MGTLSPRQLELLSLLAEGLTYAQIAKQMRVSPHTVKGAVTLLYARLGVTCAAHAVARALSDGLIEPLPTRSP